MPKPETNSLIPRAPELPDVRPESQRLANIQRLGGILAASGYFADARDMAQAAVKVMAGEELGIPAIAAMTGIAIIKGKIALGANLIASRVRAHGYDYRFKLFDGSGCILEFLGKADAAAKRATLGESSFTAEDAQRAGIASEMYKKYPRNMYFARAMSNGARWFCPEVFAGAPVYTPEELGAPVDEQGDLISQEPASPPPAAGKPAPVGTMIPSQHVKPEPSPEAQPEGSKWSWGDFKSMLDAFGKLRAQLGPDYDHIYRETLREFNVAHSNEFRDYATATACYRKLRAKVLKIEEARQSAEAAMIDTAALMEAIRPPDEEAIL